MASWLHHPRVRYAFIVAVAIFALLLVFYSSPSLPSLTPDREQVIKELPDFTQFKNVREKKQAFFDFLYPIIEEENRHLMTLRNTLKEMRSKQSLSGAEASWIRDLSRLYLNEKQQEDSLPNLLEKLIRRVDIIPPSLVLAQAAIESAWGTSRFAREGNNLFGQWCFSEGCGIVPQQRATGRTHEVAKFDTVNEAVHAYLRNLNAFHAYKTLREARRDIREQDKKLSPTPLLAGLSNYSEQGKAYLTKVARVIRQNELERFDVRQREALSAP